MWFRMSKAPSAMYFEHNGEEGHLLVTDTFCDCIFKKKKRWGDVFKAVPLWGGVKWQDKLIFVFWVFLTAEGVMHMLGRAEMWKLSGLALRCISLGWWSHWDLSCHLPMWKDRAQDAPRFPSSVLLLAGTDKNSTPRLPVATGYLQGQDHTNCQLGIQSLLKQQLILIVRWCSS